MCYITYDLVQMMYLNKPCIYCYIYVNVQDRYLSLMSSLLNKTVEKGFLDLVSTAKYSCNSWFNERLFHDNSYFLDMLSEIDLAAYLNGLQ